MHAEKKRKQAAFVRNLKELEQAQSDVLQLRLHAEEFEELIALKEIIIEEQSAKLHESRKKTLHDHAAVDKYVKGSAIYQSIQKKQFGQKLTVQELRDCRKLVFDVLPEFNDFLLEWLVEPASINERTANTYQNKIYNLQGHCIQSPKNRGLYIKNGRKYLVK